MHRVRHDKSAGQSGLRPSASEADLHAILHAGRIRLHQLALAEQGLAERFYATLASLRADLAVATVRAIGASRVRGIAELQAMGSSQYGTALHASDVDLYAPIPPTCPDLDSLRALLDGHAEYRKTRSVPTTGPRHLFAFQQDGVDVDLNLVEHADYRLAVTVVQEIAAALTVPDRIANTWIKHLLQQQEQADAYDRWKDATRLHHSPTLRLLRSSGHAA
ncbi:hypothetical protein [Streptacidiphilus sp. EB129]|uniref:hypothetical protein n=1 Tax=Streptacidiphilus sp. EB129 TaxID=3156262 RepID=UPI0035116168